MKARRAAALACVLALALAAGCAGPKPYPDDLPAKNLIVRTSTSSGSAFSSVRAELDIHSVDAQCRTQYVGTVKLDKPSIAVGIPAERWSYLAFEFASSGFLGGTRGRITQRALLRAREGHAYEADVTYRDDIYGVVLREKPPRGALRELPLLDLASCQVR